MASVYRAECSWAAISFVNSLQAFWFTAEDVNETWAIEGRRDASGFAKFFFYFNAAPDPAGSLVGGVSSQTGPDYTAYDNGGTVAIEKDEALDELRFITPLGTVTKTLTTFGAHDASVLRPRAMGFQMARVGLTADAAAAIDQWTDFYGKKDGTTFLGCAMTAVDPGVWSGFSFTNTTGAPTLPIDNGQTAGGYRTRFVYVHATDAPRTPDSREWREWEGGDNIGFNPYRLAIDAAVCPQTGFIYTLRVEDHDRTKVKFAVTADGGATFTETDIHSLGGADFVWPSLAVDPKGKILATWQNKNDQTRQYWTISETYGKTWMTVANQQYSPAGSKASTHRVRFHPVTGLLYYLFRDVLDPKLKLFADDGYDIAGFTAAGPWTTPAVVANAASDHWPALFSASIGTLFVRWTEALTKGQVSETHGATWPFVTSSTGLSLGQLSVWQDPASSFHYVLYQDTSSGDLICFASDNYGNTTLPGITGTVLAGAEQQYPAVVTDHRGRVYALYQVLSGGVYLLTCKRSENHGITWVTP